jgi:hypothetical protein
MDVEPGRPKRRWWPWIAVTVATVFLVLVLLTGMMVVQVMISLP